MSLYSNGSGYPLSKRIIGLLGQAMSNGLSVDPKFILLPLFKFFEFNLFYYLWINFDEYENWNIIYVYYVYCNNLKYIYIYIYIIEIPNFNLKKSISLWIKFLPFYKKIYKKWQISFHKMSLYIYKRLNFKMDKVIIIF